MTREEKCLLAIKKGYTYDSNTGKVFNKLNNQLNGAKHNGYVNLKLTLNNKKYSLLIHQFAWYWIHKEIVDCLDHINGIKDDNRICNLRSVSQQENLFNNSKVKGYSWDKTKNKWSASIKLNNKRIYLGSFNKEEDARQAYLQAKEIYHII